MQVLNQIEVRDKLLKSGWINKEQADRLIIKDGKVWDDTDYLPCTCSNGDVWIGNLELKRYAIKTEVNKCNS